jgi:hypothetical protein
MTVSLFWKQLDMNEEDILRITDELLLRRSFILETVLSFIYLCTILLIFLQIVLFFILFQEKWNKMKVEYALAA